jgi:nicotinate-nucleotide pyrophosphorylase (carboxylating)
VTAALENSAASDNTAASDNSAASENSRVTDAATAVDPPRQAVVEAVTRAIAEDVLPLGDLTAALIPASTVATLSVVSRAGGIIAGRACAVETLAQIDPTVSVAWKRDDGAAVVEGDVVATVTGSLRSILTAERTVLNFLGHLSGVASLTRRFVVAVSGASPTTRVLDTRKTTPGLRALEKAAVRAGGGHNHRGSLSEAVARARHLWPGRMVEVECDRIDQVTEAVAAGADVVMLDNMDPDRVAACVAEVRAAGAGTLVEVSGGVDLDTAPMLAAAGADLISVGALTHSAPVLDLAFDLPPAGGGKG